MIYILGGWRPAFSCFSCIWSEIVVAAPCSAAIFSGFYRGSLSDRVPGRASDYLGSYHLALSGLESAELLRRPSFLV